MFRLIKFELKKILNTKRIVLITLIVLISSFGLIKFSEYLYNRQNAHMIAKFDTNDVIHKMENRIEILTETYNNDSTADNLWQLETEKVILDYYKYSFSLNIDSNDWRGELFTKLRVLSLEEVPLNMYLDGVNMDNLTSLTFSYENEIEVKNRLSEISNQKSELQDIIENKHYYDYIETLISDKKEEVKLLQSEIIMLEETAIVPNYTAVSRLKRLMQEKLQSEEVVKLYNYIVENKIEDHNDWRYIVIYDIMQESNYEHMILDTKDEFQYNPDKGTSYLTYEEYNDAWMPRINEAKMKNQENWHYLNNNIKPLTLRTSEGAMLYTTRLAMNNVYFIGIISLIITTIMCGGIVASEHKTGSIRFLLTKPFKRWKILLSKLLVMLFIFLFIYLMGTVITYLLSGIMYGFGDFSIPLLINNNGIITDTSYLFFTFNNILKSALIFILFLALLFSIASVSFNIPISLSIILILIFVLIFLPYVITFNSYFNYLPIFLLNFHEVIYPTNNAFININVNSAIICSLIYSILILFITFIIYCRRDIKN